MPFEEMPYEYSGDGKNPPVHTGVGFFYYLINGKKIILNFTAGYMQPVLLRSMFVQEQDGTMSYHSYPSLELCNQKYFELKNETV